MEWPHSIAAYSRFSHREKGKRMQIETFREFIAVVQYGSFTGAAKALYLSQPTLSKHIAAFEKQIGYKLFFDVRPLMLTEAGRIAMEYASSVVSQTETMELRLEALKHHPPELIRIQDLTFFDRLSRKALSAKAATKERFPNVTFDVVKCKTHQTSLEALLADDIDVGFAFNITETPRDGSVAEHDGWRGQPLLGSTGEFRLGVPKDSPLLNRPNLRLKDFAGQRFFFIASKHYDSFIQDFRALCLAEGFLPQIEYVTVNNYQDFWTQDFGDGIIPLVAAQDEGFTAVDGYIRDAYKAIRPFGPDRTPYVSITMITRDGDHGAALQDFLSTVSALEEELAGKLPEAE